MVNVTAAKTADKNIVMLYFDLPMSSDYTSLLSGGVLRVLRSIAWEGNHGEEGHWIPSWSRRSASTIYDGPGDKQLWKMRLHNPLSRTRTRRCSAWT